jgi:pullulanase/glycogen debranching enzyme
MAAVKSLNQDAAPEAPISCPYPLGARVTPEGTNFSIFSASAKAMQIVLFNHPDDPGSAWAIQTVRLLFRIAEFAHWKKEQRVKKAEAPFYRLREWAVEFQRVRAWQELKL